MADRHSSASTHEWLECIESGERYPLHEIRYQSDTGGLLAVQREPERLAELSTDLFDGRLTSRKQVDRSGVWRFREAILSLPEEKILTHPEGSTNLYHRATLDSYAGGVNIEFKHEGENPTGSFKDRGMTAAVTMAKYLGCQAVGCASTGNTSASLAAYAAQAGLRAIVFIPSGQVAMGKLAQALGYGATCLAIEGDFDQAMELTQQAAKQRSVYMVNSLNPFRLEGQKSIIWEILQDRGWHAPEWIVVPGGNLGNTSAFGKALKEAHAAGWISTMPKIATVQAAGANPFFTSFQNKFSSLETVRADTVATAIRIGNPVNYPKAKRVIEETQGLVLEVSDEEIMTAKQAIDQVGLGCEPASAASLAGIKQLRSSGVLKEGADVVAILTGHMLKDPQAVTEPTYGTKPQLHTVEPTLAAVEKFLGN